MNNDFNICEGSTNRFEPQIPNNQKQEGKGYARVAKVIKSDDINPFSLDDCVKVASFSNGVYNNTHFAELDEYAEKDLKPAKKEQEFASINTIKQFLTSPGEHCTNPLPLHIKNVSDQLQESEAAINTEDPAPEKQIIEADEKDEAVVEEDVDFGQESENLVGADDDISLQTMQDSEQLIEGLKQEKDIDRSTNKTYIETKAIEISVEKTVQHHIKMFSFNKLKIVNPNFVRTKFEEEVHNNPSSLFDEDKSFEMQKHVLQEAIKQHAVVKEDGSPLSKKEADQVLQNFESDYRKYYRSEIRLLLEQTSKSDEKDSSKQTKESKSPTLPSSHDQDSNSQQKNSLRQLISFIAADITSEIKSEKRAERRLLENSKLIETMREKKLAELESEYFNLKFDLIRKEIKTLAILKENIQQTDLKSSILSRDIFIKSIKTLHVSLAA